MPLSSPRLWHGPTNKHTAVTQTTPSPTFPDANGVYIGLLCNLDGNGSNLISGGSTPGNENITTLEGITGKHTCLLHAGYSLATAATAHYSDIDAIVAHGSVPVISLQSGAYTHADVASGVHDADIDALGAWLRNYAPGGTKTTSSIVMRWAHEFNGSWGFKPPDAYTTQGMTDYADGFIRIFSRVKAQGASTVLSCFCPNNWYGGNSADGLGVLTGEYDIAAGFGGTNKSAWDPFYTTGGAINHLCYPGNSNVDIFGVDSYNPAHNNFISFYQSVRNSYNGFVAQDPTKPIFVMETGSGETSGTLSDSYSNLGTLGLIDGNGTHTSVNTKAQWITDVFATTLPYLSQIKGWSWFNLNTAQGAAGNYKIESHDIDATADNGVKTAYANGVADSYYLGVPS